MRGHRAGCLVLCLKETTVKINAFLASCILSLPLVVSLSGAAAAQATCPCFTAAFVNPTTCEGRLYNVTRPNYAEMNKSCDLNNLPYDEQEALLSNDPRNLFLYTLSSHDQTYATSFGGDRWFCKRPHEQEKLITVQQWHSCNQILIDAIQ
jgi:hypothetical protein